MQYEYKIPSARRPKPRAAHGPARGPRAPWLAPAAAWYLALILYISVYIEYIWIYPLGLPERSGWLSCSFSTPSSLWHSWLSSTSFNGPSLLLFFFMTFFRPLRPTASDLSSSHKKKLLPSAFASANPSAKDTCMVVHASFNLRVGCLALTLPKNARSVLR